MKRAEWVSIPQLGEKSIRVDVSSLSVETFQYAGHSLSGLDSIDRALYGPFHPTRHSVSVPHLTGHLDATTTTTDITLVLTELISYGAIWDVFSTTQPYLLLKLCCPTTFPSAAPSPDPTISEIPLLESDARRAIAREIAVYLRLVHLQGSVIPRYFGTYGGGQAQAQGGRDDVWGMVLEDAGEEVDLRRLSWDDK